MTTYECDSAAQFNDDLPEGECDDQLVRFSACMSNMANGWAVGGDHVRPIDSSRSVSSFFFQMVEYPREAGYPVGGDFPVRYYMIQIHYDNPRLVSGRSIVVFRRSEMTAFSDHRDNSGIRCYLGDELRPHDLGYLTLGTESSPRAIVIPPQTPRFVIDAFCPSKATEVTNLTFVRSSNERVFLSVR